MLKKCHYERSEIIPLQTENCFFAPLLAMTEQCYILILNEHNPTWTSQNQKNHGTHDADYTDFHGLLSLNKSALIRVISFFRVL